MILQLYIHFPFCKRKCFYCDFCSAQADAQTVHTYCEALKKEIVRMGKRWEDAQVSTVFLGGGTPSVVPAEEMRSVLEALHASFAFLPETEFTSEANPGTLTPRWLEVMTAGGMNRLSLGVQAAQDELLARIGRIHTFRQAEEAVKLARQAGVRSLNVDVMNGLPGQTEAMYLETLQKVAALSVEHISAYSLILEEGTPLYAAVSAGRMSLPEEDTAAMMDEQGMAWLEKAGYLRYEISNYARPGYECRHNLGYWQGAWYLGLGAAAHSMLPPAEGQDVAYVRRTNTADTAAYMAAMRRDESPVDGFEAVSRQEAMFETMMLGLRMTAGVGEQDFLRRHGVELTRRYGAQLDGLIRDGLGRWTGQGQERRFCLTTRGLQIQNDVLLRLMDEERERRRN